MGHAAIPGDSLPMPVKQLVNIITVGSDTAEKVSEELLRNFHTAATTVIKTISDF